MADTPVKRAEFGFILASLDRNRICLMQSPQAFRYNLIKNAYENAKSSNHPFADDAAVVEHYGHKVAALEGERLNIRISDEHDLKLARRILDDLPFQGEKHV